MDFVKPLTPASLAHGSHPRKRKRAESTDEQISQALCSPHKKIRLAQVQVEPDYISSSVEKICNHDPTNSLDFGDLFDPQSFAGCDVVHNDQVAFLSDSRSSVCNNSLFDFTSLLTPNQWEFDEVNVYKDPSSCESDNQPLADHSLLEDYFNLDTSLLDSLTPSSLLFQEEHRGFDISTIKMGAQAQEAVLMPPTWNHIDTLLEGFSTEYLLDS